jgi:hypothetical protein
VFLEDFSRTNGGEMVKGQGEDAMAFLGKTFAYFFLFSSSFFLESPLRFCTTSTLRIMALR